MQQLDDWVQWISLNFEYATRAKPYGLGLPGINVNALTKVLIIGKRDIRPEADRVAMESAASGRRPVLDIHTYDFLLSEARKATRRRIADDASPCEECSLLDDL